MKDSITFAILSSMSDGVLVFDFEGRLIFSNRAGRELLGLGPDASGAPYLDLFMNDPENDAFNDILFSGIQDRETRVYREAPFRRADGVRLDLMVATSFLRSGEGPGESEGIVVVFKDITESKALDRARHRVVDHLSHELKTPVAIIGATLKRLRTPDSTVAVDRIEHNLKRLLDIQEEVEEIVRESRGAADGGVHRAGDGSRAMEPGPFLSEVLDRALELAPDREVAIRRTIDPHAAIRAMDPDTLKKTLMAPVKNAIEATPDGGEIFVTLASGDGETVLTVRDTGVGITEESRKQIFGGFYHAKDTNLYTTKKPFAFGAGGKGLDLLRLKALATMHNFRIELESTRCPFIPLETDSCPGRIDNCPHVSDSDGCARSGGTTFRLIFPFRS